METGSIRLLIKHAHVLLIEDGGRPPLYEGAKTVYIYVHSLFANCCFVIPKVAL
jgi:hypothetical protein